MIDRMIFSLKIWIVDSLERACNFLDKHPPLDRFPRGCKLAEWSDRLDQRWGTERWNAPLTETKWDDDDEVQKRSE